MTTDSTSTIHQESKVERLSRWEQALAVLPLLAVAAIPLFFDFRGYDVWRLPKLLLLHAAGILLIGGFIAASLFGAIDLRAIATRNRLLGVILGWWMLSALFAEHRPTAFWTLVTIVTASAVFIALRHAAVRWQPYVALVLLVPASINSIVALLQELKIWNPFVPEEVRSLHAGTVGLLGNSNDVGSFLVPAFTLAAAWVVAARRMATRVLAAALALTIGAGIAASQTRAALLAMGVVVAVLMLLRWGRAAIFRVAGLVVIAALALAMYRPVIDRMLTPLARADLGRLSSGRIVPFGAAWEMIKDNPLFGVGPGCFGHQYFDYAVEVYPKLRAYSIAGRQMNFGETHNDHLQIAAEAGIPGFLLFAAVLFLIARISFRRDLASERETFARYLALPLVAGAAVLMLLQFPLYAPASLTAYLFTAALTLGWSRA